MSRRPRLLFLCQTLPYPLDGGVWIRTFHVYRLLSTEFDVTLLCFERLGESGRRYSHDLAESVAELERFGRVRLFTVPQNHSRRVLLWNHLRSTALGHAYTRYVYEAAEFRHHLRDLMATGDFDLVHFDSLDLAGYLEECGSTPIVCVHHNVESQLLRRRSEVEGGWARRFYFGYQARLTQKEELRWVPRVALNVAVSEQDKQMLLELCPDSRIEVVPNGVDVKEFAPQEGADDGVVYIGGTNWFPNLDALDHFCDDILPHLRRRGVSIPVRWIGSASDPEKEHYSREHGVELTGYVDDVRPYMRDAFCHIVPLRAGGGTRLKILNSWAMGKAVVTTSIGCEGLDAEDGVNSMIRDDPHEFAEAILELERDPGLRSRLGNNARETALRTYSWDVTGIEMTRMYLDLVEASERRRTSADTASR